MFTIFLKFFFILKRKLASIPSFKRVYSKVMNEFGFQNLYHHEYLLADKIRIYTYCSAITKYIKQGDIVVDLGTGCGILSFIASLNHPRLIYAIDHSNIIKKAQFVAECNSISNIQFKRVYSKNFTIPEKADVIVQEQMGSWLFNEDMVECVLDLRDRFLKKSGKILPSKFDFFIEPVVLKDESRVPFIWEQKIKTIDFHCLRKFKSELKNRQIIRFITQKDIKNYLCIPSPILSFDLETLKSPTDLPLVLTYERVIDMDGYFDGFCIYFRAIFDEDIILDNSPLERNLSYCNWAYPLFRVESTILRKGDRIKLTINVSDLTKIDTWDWSYQIKLCQ